MLNADDERVARFAEVARGRVMTFGIGSYAPIFARKKSKSAASKARRFDFVSPGGRARLALPLLGRHNVMNALGGARRGERLGHRRGRGERGVSVACPGGQARRGGALRRGIYGDQRFLQLEPFRAECDDRTSRRQRPATSAGFWLPAKCSSSAIPRRNCIANAAVQPRGSGKSTGFSACEATPRNSFARPSKPGIRLQRAQFFENSAEAAQFLDEIRLRAAILLLVKGSRGVKMEKILEAIDAEHRR